MDAPQSLTDRTGREVVITIQDTRTGKRKVDLRLPANLAVVALRSGARLLPAGHDPADLVAALEASTPLDLEINDDRTGEQVRISIR